MKSIAVFVLAVILAPAAHAQHQTFTINPDASELKMTLNTTQEVIHGAFHIRSGSIDGLHSGLRKAARLEASGGGAMRMMVVAPD